MLERIRKKRELIVEVSSDWPYCFPNEKDGVFTGVDADIIKYAAKMPGIEKVPILAGPFEGLGPGSPSGQFETVGDSTHVTADR